MANCVEPELLGLGEHPGGPKRSLQQTYGTRWDSLCQELVDVLAGDDPARANLCRGEATSAQPVIDPRVLQTEIAEASATE